MVDAMSFPLIQQDSPLQKLADVLRTIRTDMEARRANQEQLRRQQEYLQLHQAQFAAQERERGVDNARASRAEQRQTRLDDIAVQQGLEDRKRRGILDENAMTQQRIAGVRAGLPDNVTITDEAALLSPEHRQVLLQGATADARQGLQGSASRAPVMGSYKGVTVDPGMRNVNLPAGGGGVGGRGPSTQDRLMQAAIGGALDQMVTMEQFEDRNPMNATIPNLTAIVDRGGRLPYVGGLIQAVAGPAGQAAMSPEQQSYQAMAGEFIHTYASSLPGRRLGPELLQVIHHNFFPRAGQTDPNVIAEFRRRRREAAVRMARASYGQVEDLESLLEPALRQELDRVAPREDTVQPAQNATGQTVGVPAAGSQQPPSSLPMPTILPRYQNR